MSNAPHGVSGHLNYFKRLIGDYTLAISIYEMLARSSSQFPDYIPYVELAPAHVRRELFSKYKGSLPLNSRGQVNIKVFFELLLNQYLNDDYGEDGIYGLSTLSSKRCAVLAHVIGICEYKKSSLVPRGI